MSNLSPTEKVKPPIMLLLPIVFFSLLIVTALVLVCATHRPKMAADRALADRTPVSCAEELSQRLRRPVMSATLKRHAS